MEISLGLILDELGLETELRISKGKNPKFTSVELYVPGETSFSADTLLVCSLSEAIAANAKGRAYFICTDDIGRGADTPCTAGYSIIDVGADISASAGGRIISGGDGSFIDCGKFDADASLRGITVISGSVDLRELFNRVLRVFVRITQWVMELERSVLKRKGLKSLLEISEPILKNFITLQDSTFKLLCYTESIKPPGPIMRDLVQLGYHPPETMELFRKHRRLEQFKMFSEVIVNHDGITSDNAIVKKTIHLSGNNLVMVVMECCVRPANIATVELFEILIEYIKYYAEQDLEETGAVGGIKALAFDILSKDAGTIEQSRTRAAYCGFDFDGCFRLYVFSFEDNDNVPTSHLIHLLSEVFTDSVVLAWKQNIILIENEFADVSETCIGVEGTLEHTDFICGISDDFACLWNLPAAYEQAKVAMDVSMRLKAPEKGRIHECFRRFSDCFIHYIISSSYQTSPEIFDNSFVVGALSILREHDERHRTETAKILRVFLENERSATVTASIMHMHRNTVLYHMEKISSLLGLSLDNPETRLQLLLAYKADDFKS